MSHYRHDDMLSVLDRLDADLRSQAEEAEEAEEIAEERLVVWCEEYNRILNAQLGVRQEAGE